METQKGIVEERWQCDAEIISPGDGHKATHNPANSIKGITVMGVMATATLASA